MKYLRRTFLILSVLGSQACSGATPANSALAQSAVLQEESPTTDQRVVPPTFLQGFVHHNDTGQSIAGSAQHTNPLSAQIKDDTTKDDTSKNNPIKAQASKDEIELQKLNPHADSRHPKRFPLSARNMTTEDYRNVNFGVLGMVASRSMFSSKQIICVAFADCPAALAGVEPGDIEIKTDDHVWSSKDNQRSNWNISDGRAGTPVDMTVQRGKELLTFHMIRMNIEDIQNDRLRRAYERMLRRFGPPTRCDQVSEIRPTAD